MPSASSDIIKPAANTISLRRRASSILKKLAVVHPDPKCELYYQTPYQLLVSVVLSAQTTDKSVNRCMEPLYKKGLSPQLVLKMGEAKFREKIKTIGLAPTKAKNVIRLTGRIINEFDGSIPRTREDLESLPGVGRKTANVILGEIYGEPTIAVDTHVFRVSHRLGLHDEKTPEKAEQVLLALIAPKFLPKGHHHFILHGRYTCTARNPKCLECPLKRMCHFEKLPS